MFTIVAGVSLIFKCQTLLFGIIIIIIITFYAIF